MNECNDEVDDDDDVCGVIDDDRWRVKVYASML